MGTLQDEKNDWSLYDVIWMGSKYRTCAVLQERQPRDNQKTITKKQGERWEGGGERGTYSIVQLLHLVKVGLVPLIEWKEQSEKTLQLMFTLNKSTIKS